MSLAADPPVCALPAGGGASTHQLINSSEKKIAFKVKTSNNDLYRIKPVFGFGEPGGCSPIDITRLSGAPKEDKLVIQYVETAPDAKDASAPFKTSSPAQITLPMKAQ
ncbi:hypothetical protein PMAYCL1PPCAC_12759 [Pristionchus mayeri]|uniref:MSP domain-containing protein n=1 Tax=Pristionchus mayeri TaxID=1317129 RepID=A0AAN4ZMF5_9BILA|nr:hypothetical protein PMAYCL1PPCAC_12759 [Pristionchus mayeri]